MATETMATLTAMGISRATMATATVMVIREATMETATETGMPEETTETAMVMGMLEATMETATATGMEMATDMGMETARAATTMETETETARVAAAETVTGMEMGRAAAEAETARKAMGRNVRGRSRLRRLLRRLQQAVTEYYQQREIQGRKEVIAWVPVDASSRRLPARPTARRRSPRRTGGTRAASSTAAAAVKPPANVNKLSQTPLNSFTHQFSSPSNSTGRKPNCNEYGSICYDPRFVGGDGVMFYFHGSKGNNFAVVSDQTLHINAHFIGNRPQGRTSDFTWVQAISLMFDTNTLVLAANRVSQWNDKVDALIVKWNGDSISVPTDGESEWRITTGEKREVVIERTVDVNTVRATVSGLVEMDMRVTPIGEKENRVHHYQLPSDDAFAHLEVQFSFFNLSNGVEGVLGKTYRPRYVSPVKRGVPMPIMGGEDKYRTPSLYSPSCKLCIFQRPSAAIAVA